MNYFKDFLIAVGISDKFSDFAESHNFDPVSVYEACQNHEWIVWWGRAKKALSREAFILLAIELAETVADIGPRTWTDLLSTAKKSVFDESMVESIGRMGNLVSNKFFLERDASNKAGLKIDGKYESAFMSVRAAAWAANRQGDITWLPVMAARYSQLAAAGADDILARQRTIIDSYLKIILTYTYHG